MTAYQAVLEALIGRATTGEGRHIAVSLFHALADWMNVPYLQYAYGGKVPPRAGLNHPTIAPYGVYEGSDGKSVLISIQNEREWATFCEAILGDAALARDPRFDNNSNRVANRAALDAILRPVFAALPRDAMAERLRAARIAYGRVSDLEDLHTHPHARHVTVQTPSGPVRMLAPGALFDNRSSGPDPPMAA